MKIFKKIADISLFVCFIIMNLLHLIFTIWVIIEQFKMNTSGTDLEMLALLPFILEICTLPAIIFEIVCLIIFKGKLSKTNIIFFALFLLQCVLFNLFLII